MSDEQKHIRGTHPNSLANLEATKWKPGQTGNPNGTRKYRLVSDKIRDILETEVPELASEFNHVKDLIVKKPGHIISVQDVMAAVAVYKALNGNFKFLKLIMDRLEGPIAKRIEGEIEHTTDIDKMSNEELGQLLRSIRQKRLSFGPDEGIASPGIPD